MRTLFAGKQTDVNPASVMNSLEKKAINDFPFACEIKAPEQPEIFAVSCGKISRLQWNRDATKYHWF